MGSIKGHRCVDGRAQQQFTQARVVAGYDTALPASPVINFKGKQVSLCSMDDKINSHSAIRAAGDGSSNGATSSQRWMSLEDTVGLVHCSTVAVNIL